MRGAEWLKAAGLRPGCSHTANPAEEEEREEEWGMGDGEREGSTRAMEYYPTF